VCTYMGTGGSTGWLGVVFSVLAPLPPDTDGAVVVNGELAVFVNTADITFDKLPTIGADGSDTAVGSTSRLYFARMILCMSSGRLCASCDRMA